MTIIKQRKKANKKMLASIWGKTFYSLTVGVQSNADIMEIKMEFLKRKYNNYMAQLYQSWAYIQ